MASKKRTTKRTPKAISMNDEAKWQAEDDVRTLIRADEIKKDKSRMARAKRMAKKQAAKAKKVAASFK